VSEGSEHRQTAYARVKDTNRSVARRVHLFRLLSRIGGGRTFSASWGYSRLGYCAIIATVTGVEVASTNAPATIVTVGGFVRSDRYVVGSGSFDVALKMI
jgi:hypothetical protein